MEELVMELRSVIAVMNTIPIEGLESQKRFVNCAERIRLVADIIQAANQPEEKQEPEKKEAVKNG